MLTPNDMKRALKETGLKAYPMILAPNDSHIDIIPWLISTTPPKGYGKSQLELDNAALSPALKRPECLVERHQQQRGVCGLKYSCRFPGVKYYLPHVSKPRRRRRTPPNAPQNLSETSISNIPF